MGKIEYVQMRLEFNRPSNKQELVEKFGKVCANCGSNLDIEYHHVVPLYLGGTNRITNIVPLCRICHQIAHGGRNIRHLEKPENSGRPRKQPIEGYEVIIDDYIFGRIGRKECEKRLNNGKSTKLYDIWYYKECLDKRGIKKIQNKIDLTSRSKRKSNEGMIASIIYYNDGTKHIEYQH